MTKSALSEAVALTAPLFALLEQFERRGEFVGYVITIVDDENHRYRNVYEDIETEQGQRERRCVVSLYPEYGVALAEGVDPSCDQEVITHGHALRDIRRMLKTGWRLAAVEQE